MNDSSTLQPTDNPAATSTQKSGPTPLPEFTRQSWFLLLIWPLLQTILLILNIRDFHLVSGEMSEKEILIAHDAGFLSGLNIALGLIFCLAPRLKERLLHPLGLLAMMAVQVGFLWWLVAYLGDMHPSSVPNWILSTDQLFGRQFIFTMPTIFFGLVTLATTRLPLTTKKDIGLSLASLIAPPAITFLMGYIVSHLNRFSLFNGAEYLLLVLFIIGTLLVFLGLFRVLMWCYGWLINRGNWMELILLLAVAIAAPLGGLALNRSIPFPFDFQTPGVYVLTIINGLILCLPPVSNRWGRVLIWFFQAVTFPFTLYFFLVFIPFFPLAIPAIVVAGAGFLVLTPAALFFVHLSRLKRGFSDLTAAGWSRVSLTALVLIALFTLPIGYLLRCNYDRANLHQALDYVYSTDSEKPLSFAGSRHSVKRSLESLRNRKAGIWLPFLTGIYSNIVFDGLVLPDSKLKHMYFVFTGTELDLAPPASTFFGTSSRRQNWRNQNRQPRPIELEHRVDFQQLNVTETSRGDSIQTQWHLIIHNPGKNQDEFVLHFKPSSGAWINDLELKIGDSWEKGRLSERKAAIWIYEMIRDRTRRDPALLHYLDEQTVELRVFPLAGKETREVRISFLHPAGIKPTRYLSITPSEQSITRADVPTAESRLQQSDQGALLWLQDATDLPVITRTPSLHLLFDISTSGFQSTAAIVECIDNLQESLPEITSVRATFFHLNTVSSFGDPDGMSWLQLQKAVEASTSLFADAGSTGAEMGIGRHTEGVILTSLRTAENRATRSVTGAAVPALLILSPSAPQKSELIRTLPLIRKANPDFPYLGWTRKGQVIHWHHEAEEGSTSLLALPQPTPVHVVRLGTSIAVSLSGESSPGFIFKSPPTSNTPEFLHPNGWWESKAVRASAPDSEWSQAAALWTRSQTAALNPFAAEASWLEDIKTSKETGILSPLTAYIVVENSAQWRKLAEAEKKRLQGDKELDIMETPEPGTWALLVMTAVFFLLRSRRIHKWHKIVKG